VVWIRDRKHGKKVLKVKKKQNEINAFLGRDTEFEGKLAFTGAVRIDGRFRGEILTEGTLIVGESAHIESDIHASHIIVSGEIRGNIVADDRIEIHAPGKVYGNINAPTVVIDEGVVFEGHCRMRGEQEREAGREEDEKLAAVR
jgi:cytoskeletal protein CcmA (bactofilin family)